MRKIFLFTALIVSLLELNGWAQTECQINSVPQLWDFETNNTGGTSNNPLPYCWTRATSSTSPFVDSNNLYYPDDSYYLAYSGTHYLRLYNTVEERPMVVLPAVNTDSLNINDLQISFYLKNQNPHVENLLEIGVMSDAADTSTFTVLHTIHSYGDQYEAFELPLSDYTGSGTYIAIRALGVSGWYTFALLDDLRIEAISSCPRPSNLTYDTPTDTSVQLSWTGYNSLYTDFTVYFKRVQDSVWNSHTFSTGSLEYLLTGLIPSSVYQVYVISDCRPNDPSSMVWFNTECGPIPSAPMFWDFESGYYFYPDLETMDYCWGLMNSAFIDYSPFFPFISSQAYSGVVALKMQALSASNTDAAMDAVAIMPEIDTDMLDMHNLQISFYAKASYDGNADFELQVGMLSDPSDTTTFITLHTITSIGGTWQYYNIPLSDYTGNGTYPTLRWKSFTPSGSVFSDYADLMIDDVTIEEISGCPPPSILTVDSVQNNAITFSWLGFNANYPNYILYYKPCDGVLWDYLPITVSSPTYTLTGLVPSSLYQLFLSLQCDTSVVSEVLTAGTLCSPVTTVPQSWDFEEAGANPLPYCWNRHTDPYNEYPVVIANAEQSLSGVHCFQFATSERSVAILPEINRTVLDFNVLQLSLSIKATSSTSNSGVKVGVMTDPTDTSTFVPLMEIHSLAVQYQTFDVPLSDYADTGSYLAILSEGTVGVFIEDVSIDSIPVCQRPSNLIVSDLTTESAVLQWTGYNLSEPHYTLYYKRTDAFVWNAVPMYTYDASCTLTGLLPSTTYQVYMVPDCNPALVSNTITFKTACGVYEVPHTWDFEDVNIYNAEPNPISECWGRVPSDYPYVFWNWGSSIGHSGTKVLRFIAQTSAFGILPYIDSTYLNVSDLQVSFYALCSGGGPNNLLTVGVMTDPTDTSTFVPVETLAITSSDYALYSVPLYAYTGNGAYIAIHRAYSMDFNSFYVDDVTLETIPNCAAPVNLTVGNVTTNSAQLTWMHNAANSFAVHYRLAGASTWQTDTSHSLSHTLTGLQAGYSYEAYVTALCDENMASQTVTFATNCMIIDSVPMFWDFENDNLGGTASQPLPRCWTRVESSQSNHPPYVYDGTNYAYSGTHSLDFWQAMGCYVVLPVVDTDVLPVNMLQLSFYMKRFANSPHCIEVGVMTNPDDTATFVTVQSYSDIPNSYQLYNVSFSGYDGNGAYIAFREHSPTVYNDICIDDLTLLLTTGCDAPQSLQAVVESRSAMLSWEHNSDSVLYIIHYREVSEGGQWMTDTATASEMAGFLLDGLEPLHTYMVYVVADCNPPSAPSNTVTFTTPCAEDIIEVPQSWYFETSDCGSGTLPYCWQLIDVNNNPYPRMLESGAGGSGCLNFWRAPGNIAVLPFINDNYLNINDLEISFSIKDYFSGNNGAVEVGVMSDPTDTATFTLVQTINGLTTAYQHVVVSFAGYTGSGKHIALRDAGVMAGANPYDVYLDSLVLSHSVAQPCDAPTGLSMETTNQDSLSYSTMIEWDDNQEVALWEVQYKMGNNDWTTVPVNDHFYLLENLLYDTLYLVRVRSVCNDGDTSDWTNAEEIQLLVGIEEYLSNSIILFPNPAKEVVNVQYTIQNLTGNLHLFDVYGRLLQIVPITSETTSINVSGLADGIYFVRVITDQGVITKSFVKQ